jgi:hypothetical protein
MTSNFGDPRLPSRFWMKLAVNMDGGCWTWTASGSNGYGRFQVGRGSRQAHRIAYEALVGPIPAGLQLDHLCRNRGCCNPAHLEPVTQQENIRRGENGKARGIQQRAKTTCPAGHPYSGENLLVRCTGKRACRTCERGQPRRSRARPKEPCHCGLDFPLSMKANEAWKQLKPIDTDGEEDK